MGSLKYFGQMDIPALYRNILYFGFAAFVAVGGTYLALLLRTFGLDHFGYVLHNSEPWFNYRATEYLSENGWTAFFHWFDYMSWYPLGRPVGTTIYPGLQITGVAIHRTLNALGYTISLHDVCMLVPVWSGLAGMLLLALLTFEVSHSWIGAAFTIAVYGILPAHAMHTVAGEFDLPSVGLTAMVLTLLLWARALRCPKSWPIAALAGLAYGFLASTWGSYVFVMSLIAIQTVGTALFEWARGVYSPFLFKSYAVFFVIGTAAVMCVPQLGFSAVASLPQLPGLCVFAFMCGLHVCEARRQRLGFEIYSRASLRDRIRMIIFIAGVLVTLASAMVPRGYFAMPINGKEGWFMASGYSARRAIRAAMVASGRDINLGSPRRGMFMDQEVMGTEGVDGDDESNEYAGSGFTSEKDVDIATLLQTLHVCYVIWVISLVGLILGVQNEYTPARLLVLLYSMICVVVCIQMPHLFFISIPVAALMTGVSIGWAVEKAAAGTFWDESDPAGLGVAAATTAAEGAGETGEGAAVAPRSLADSKKKDEKKAKKKRGKTSRRGDNDEEETSDDAATDPLSRVTRYATEQYSSIKAQSPFSAAIICAVPVFCIIIALSLSGFMRDAVEMGGSMAEPGIISANWTEDGDMVLVRDYLDAYQWLQAETPRDSRVLTWWEHGQHVVAIGNRTTLADSATTTVEHIALVARMFTSSVAEAHSVVRHMADYILIWGGIYDNSDLFLLSGMARVADAMFDGMVCLGDTTCDQFLYKRSSSFSPSPLLRQSLLYNLHFHQASSSNVAATGAVAATAEEVVGEGESTEDGVDGEKSTPGKLKRRREAKKRKSKHSSVSVDSSLFREVYTSEHGLVRIFKVMDASKESKAWVADPANRVCNPPGSWICPGQYPPAKEIQDMLAQLRL